MGTEIKNTLFSMVTLRAPQPAVKENEAIRFVFRGASVATGAFDTAVNGITTSRWEAMRQAATSFTHWENENDVRTLNPELYDFAVWIAQTSSPIDLNDFNTALKKAKPLKETDGDYGKLWDNLFYQVVTQQNFYVKDAIIQMLVANKIATYQGKIDETILDDLKNAKVVLPAGLFVELDSNNNAIGITNKSAEDNPTQTYPDFGMRQWQEASLATLNIQSYQVLQKELASVERAYRKEFNAEYTKQKGTYDTTNKPLWDAYYADKEKAKKTWCSIRDPKIPIDPNNPCDKADFVPLPNVPEFVFQFRDELDLAYLQKQLSEASFEALANLVDITAKVASAKNDLTGSIDDFNGFADLNNYITSSIATARQTVVATTPVVAPTFVSYGGIMVAMASRAVTPFNYTMCAKSIPVEKVNFDLKFDVPDSSWHAVNVVCGYQYTSSANMTVDGQPYQTNTINPAVDNLITIPNIFSAGIPKVVFSNIHKVTVTIDFSNGCTKTFTIANFSAIACFTGIMTGDLKGGTPTTPTLNSGEKLFIPSGYGMKQIGIADYKKVEQSVQCYVEGEVAHIENVMAREHRSKSTRRLLKTDTTTTDKKEYDKENTTDTSTTTRFEMQNEVAQVLQDSKDAHADSQFNYDSKGGYSFGLNAGFAAHNSKEENTRQAITQAKEITQKATERVTNKVMQERVQKIVEEYEENNVHEFDNRKGDKHVVGVYRWVDKIYKNQIVNYGKRLMFEFMIPQPAKLHTLGMTNTEVTETIAVPVDPRKYTNPSLRIDDYSKINDTTIKYWAAYYGVEITSLPEDIVYVGKAFSKSEVGDNVDSGKNKAITDTIGIPDNYIGVSAEAIPQQVPNPNYHSQIKVTLQNKEYVKEYPVTMLFDWIDVGTVYVSVKCQLQPAFKQKWQQNSFKAIMDKYYEALDGYNKKLEDQKSKAVDIKTTNPGFYRQIENIILRKNCISYMIDQTTTARNTYGKDMMKPLANIGQVVNFGNYEVAVSQDLDNYAALVKFMEQAFEWKIMSYHFYPYYWANRTEWQKMYQFNDSDDALFRSFMQAGMARVIVTVTPGFEEAVRFYMQTGLIWNGGQVPVIEDKLYMSIVDELREPTGKPEGKAWATRLPTSMTILQANSIGLEVKKALPCNCDEVNSTTFENPEMIPCNDSFYMSNAQIGGVTGTAKLIGKVTGPGNRQTRIILKTQEGLQQDFTNTDENGEWELIQIPAGVYSLSLDSLDAYPDTDFVVTDGEKEQEITLETNQVIEVNLVFAKRNTL
jgi:hypothetical protein